MALRFYNEHQSIDGQGGITWRLEIHDADFVGEEYEFKVADGASLNYRGKGEDVYEPVLASSLSFTMMIEDTTHEDLIEDVITANEGRFTVVVKKDGVFYWAGVVNSYDGEIQDAYYPYGFRISAVDGLALLKNYEYREETTIPDKKWNIRYEGQDRIIEIIDRCLKKLPHVAQHFAGASKFLVTAINWYSDQSPIPGGATDDPLYDHYLDNRAFAYGLSSGGGYFTSAYDVIAQILRPFGARIGLFDGYFLIEQIEHRFYTIDSGANYSRYYAYDGTGPTSNTLDDNQEIGRTYDVKKLRGGTYSFLPPLKSVVVEQQTDALRNLLEGAVFDDGDVEVYNVGGVFGNGVDSYVRLKFNVEWALENISIAPNSKLVGVFRVRFLLDGNYATRTLTILSGGTWSVSAYSWSGSLSYLQTPVKMELAATGETWTGQGGVDLLFSTDSTFSYGNLSMSVEFVSLYNDVDIENTNNYSLSWAVKDPYCCILNSVGVAGLNAGLPYPKKVSYEVIGDEENSETYKVETKIGDTAPNVLNQWGGILFDTTGSGDFVYTTDWASRTGTRDKTIAQLLAARIISHLYCPRKVLRGTAVGQDFVVQTPVEENGHVYILRSGTLRTDRDEFTGEWVRLKIETPELTYAPVQYDTGDYDASSPAGGSSGGGGGGTGVDNGGSGSGGGGGNGIYGGSGTVPDGTVAAIDGDFSLTNSTASAGEAITIAVDDGTNSSTIRAQATDGILLQATGSDDIEIEGITRLTDVITSASLGADQNNYAGFDGANVGRLTASTAVNITGIASGVGGRILALHNVGSNPVTLANASASSTAANRFDIGEDYTLRADHGCLIQYDSTDSRWRIIGADRLGRLAESYTTSTATTASLTADTPATNVGVALVPKGTGAVLSSVPDGTATGGNARGQYAVDLQRLRTNNTDVASGNYSTIPGGRRCTASGTYSFATGFRAVASGAGSVAFGGSGSFSTGASATGSNSFAFGTGADATATSAIAFLADASAQQAFALHRNATMYQHFATLHLCTLGMSEVTLGTGAQELFLDGNGGSLRALVPANTVWTAEVRVVARVLVVGDGTGLTIGDVYSARYGCVIQNLAGTTALVGTVQTLMAAQSAASMSGASFTIAADNTNDALTVTYTPGPNEGSTTQVSVYATIWYSEH